jgi:hypothetical protein
MQSREAWRTDSVQATRQQAGGNRGSMGCTETIIKSTRSSRAMPLFPHLSGFGETLTTAAPVSPGGSGGTRQITTVSLHDSDLDVTVTLDQPSPSLTLLAENDAKSPPPGAVASPL